MSYLGETGKTALGVSSFVGAWSLLVSWGAGHPQHIYFQMHPPPSFFVQAELLWGHRCMCISVSVCYPNLSLENSPCSCLGQGHFGLLPQAPYGWVTLMVCWDSPAPTLFYTH